MKDLEILSRQFAEYEVPKDKQYLLHYFKGALQVAFLKYLLVMKDPKQFSQHTGYGCSTKLIDKLLKRYKDLTALHKAVKTSFTEEGMGILLGLEAGTLKLKDIDKLIKGGFHVG